MAKDNDSFEGSPPWMSGAGQWKPVNAFWTDPKKTAQKKALIAAAKQYGVSPQDYYNSLVYIGLNPSTIDPNHMDNPVLLQEDEGNARAAKHAELKRAMLNAETAQQALGSGQTDNFSDAVMSNPAFAGLTRDVFAAQKKAKAARKAFEEYNAAYPQAAVDVTGAPAGVAAGETTGEINIPQYGPDNLPDFLKDFQEQKNFPGVAAQFSPYLKRPGILKSIADIAASRLEERSKMKPSDRVYHGDRIATFNPEQIAAQKALGQIASATPRNNSIHNSILANLEALQGQNPLNTANEYLQQGTSPVTDEERGAFRNSAMKNVVVPLQEKMLRDLQERILPQIQTNRIMKGNLYGGGTDKLRERALENFNRDSMEVALPHLFAAEQQGQQAAERQRQAQINAGQIHAPASMQAQASQRETAQARSEALRQKQMQGIISAEAGLNAGNAQQNQQQRALDVQAGNWEAENYGLIDEAAAASNLVRGMPQLPTIRSGAQPALTPSFNSTLGQLAVGAGFANMMQPPAVAAKPAKTGGRIKLASGGIASSPISGFRDSLSSGDFLSKLLNNGGNDQSAASQMVQQDMMNQPPAPPPPAQPIGGVLGEIPMPAPAPVAPEGGPLERGGQSALSALEKMNQYRSSMEQQANSLDSGAHDTNPIIPFLARTFIGAAGSKNMDLGQRLGEGAQGGYEALEQQRAVNARNKELSTNIKKALIETHQKEYEHEQTLENARKIAEVKATIKANAAVKPKFYYNQQTGTHYTVGEDGQMMPAPGAPSPQTPQMKLDEELSKVRQVEAVKSEESNINKLQDDVNKAQRSIGNYNTIISLMKDTGINKYIGPMKSKFYQNDKVQGLLLNKKTVSEIRTFNSSLNKAVLDDIKLTGANPSDRDVAIVENSKPSNSDTPQAALKKALINKAAYERNLGFANFTKKMWREKGWQSYKSQEVYNRWMQANPLFSADGETILKPKDKPEDYANATDEKSHDIVGQPDYGPDEVVTEYAPKSSIPVNQLLKDQDKIKAALAAKKAAV